MNSDEAMYVPIAVFENEIEMKRSRFIARAEPVESPKQAKERIAERRCAHPGANHVVYAFIVGRESSETSGMGDDGEPKGTAARPIMEILKGRGIRNILVTVTRYFGGIKLGTGGLVRAYGDAAKAVLDAVEVRELLPRKPFILEIHYDSYENARKILTAAEAEIGGEDFNETVTITGNLPEKLYIECSEAIRDITSGKARFLAPE